MSLLFFSRIALRLFSALRSFETSSSMSSLSHFALMVSGSPVCLGLVKQVLTEFGREKEAKAIRLPKHGKPRVVVYSPEDIESLLKACKILRNRLMLGPLLSPTSHTDLRYVGGQVL
jgi:hypothetical protein